MNTIKKMLCSSFLWVLLAPWAVSSLGAASNQLVLIANHDTFPVMVNPVKLSQIRAPRGNDDLVTAIFGKPRPSPRVEVTDDSMIDSVHCVMTKDTHLNFLADIFDLKEAIYSVGDFGLTLGDWLQTFCPYVFLALVFRKCWEADAV
jgi:hypothetical protein